MKTLLKGVISVLIILGIVKTFQDHDILNEASYYYEQAKSGELVQDLSYLDVDMFKNLDIEYLKPSDFF